MLLRLRSNMTPNRSANEEIAGNILEQLAAI
jgi:hypothetical protein